MSYKAILTHNPQDFFEGIEPDELRETIEFDNNGNKKEITKVLDMVSDGYKAIIFHKEGLNDGR